VLVNNKLFETARRGLQLNFSSERRVFVTNQTGTRISAKFFRLDDSWRWVTLAGGDLIVQSGDTIEFEILPELSGVQVVVPGVQANAAPGDRLSFLGNGRIVLL
jgi:hypothetical protein